MTSTGLLRDILKGKLIIVGIGNILRGDDGAGSVLVQGLVNSNLPFCYDTGTTPENYFGKILKEKPDTVLFIDAVSMDGKPGEWKLLDPLDIEKYVTNTHCISLNHMVEELKRETGCKAYLLGIQPGTLVTGSEISSPVLKSLRILKRMILKSIKSAVRYN